MKKQADLLKTLNALRIQLGKKELPEWKASETELKRTINATKLAIKDRADKEAQDKANAESDEPVITNSQAKDLKTMKTKKNLKAMAEDVKAKAKTPKAKAQADAVIKKGTKQTDKAEGATDRFAGLDPKVARAKLRKAFGANWKTMTAAETVAFLRTKK